MPKGITLEDVARIYPPVPMLNYEPPKYNGTVLALGEAVYEAVPQAAYDNRRRFIESIARDFAPGNLWLLPTFERLTFPLSAYWPLACAFKAEQEQGRRFDWYLWSDDDAMYDASDVRKLVEGAKKHDAKFIAALPYDRMPPHEPAVIEEIDGEPWKWRKAPAGGCYPVATAGFLLCLFHRSVFDLVPEPWFDIEGPSRGRVGIQPDWWWCTRMRMSGLQPWVCCDTNVTHLGHKVRIDRQASESIVKPFDKISELTGAHVAAKVEVKDGRNEYLTRRTDWSDSTVTILTCDRDKDLLDLTVEGLKVFWPTINVAVLKDTDPQHEQPIPDDVRAIVRRIPYLRKVFDLPWIAKTDNVFCIDSDCFMVDQPREWDVGMGLYVLPGSAGKDWLAKAAQVHKELGQDFRTDRIFCGGCWSADRRKMFDKEAIDYAIKYVRRCVELGFDKVTPGYAVIMEQHLLNWMFHRAYPNAKALPNLRFPLDVPNERMACYHLHFQKSGEMGRRIIDAYRECLRAKRG